MHVNKNSWHYKWYNWTYSAMDDKPPFRTNLCQYVQRMWYGPLMVLSMFALIVVMATLYYTVGTVIALFFGYRPYSIFTKNGDMHEGPYDPYHSKVYPWHVALVGGLLGVEYLSFMYHTELALVVHLAITVVIGVIWLCFYWSNSETTNVTKAWISAKKSRICPFVEFTEEPTSTDVNE